MNISRIDFFFFFLSFFGLNGIWTNYDDHDRRLCDLSWVVVVRVVIFRRYERMDLNFSERDYYVSRAGKYLLEYRSNIC